MISKYQDKLKLITPYLSLVILLILISLIIFKYFMDFKNNSFKEINYLNQISKLNEENLNALKEIRELKENNLNLSNLLANEQSKNQLFENQINFINNQVGQLSKFVSLDKELLKKYSKVYFLNENYAPKNISLIDSKYTYGGKEKYIHTEVLPFLINMLNDASIFGINLKIISAYRSFMEQVGLKSQYTITYGSGANKFSADQGYSEHQLGTTVDFTTDELGNNFDNFGKTKAYNWLKNNAYKYGFVLSYPENNKYYIFEPWHWRFVGIKLAKYLYENKKYFYELDQKEIDQYLIYIFDRN
ncbi:MAG: M15 family metallopeptidase [Patescibacteria group bacterium]|nr:M15 family metallopeptidase [Patescibacteria group bacterium]